MKNNAAMQFHDVVITHEQTRDRWCAGRAAIENGRIVVAGSRIQSPPEGMLDRRSATFTITATDGCGRTRCFPNLVLDHPASRPPRRWVFA